MANFARQILVLDSHYQPARILSLQAGFVLTYSGRATSLVDSPHTIRSVTSTWTIPWIIRLHNSPPKRARDRDGLRFSRQNVYLRDGHTCAYCGNKFGLSHLTLDHLVPIALGGKTNWNNIVTACKNCNSRKGSKTIEELGVRLSRVPQRPQYGPAVLFALRYNLHRGKIPTPWLSFLDPRSLARAKELKLSERTVAKW